MSIITNARWELLEQRRGSAFGLAGVLILASLAVPAALGLVTDRAWVAGLLLVGVAVVSVAAGLAGLYSDVSDQVPRLAVLGIGAATIAGLGALGLIALVVLGLAGQTLGVTLADPMGVFSALGLAMAGGFALGFLLFGFASWFADRPSRTVAGLLLLGGMALITPVGIEVLGLTMGIETPPWVLFPVIGLVALDAIAVGYLLRARA